MKLLIAFFVKIVKIELDLPTGNEFESVCSFSSSSQSSQHIRPVTMHIENRCILTEKKKKPRLAKTIQERRAEKGNK